ncbi:MAG TPA: cyclic nucleotide-binding domain-containing protein [Candidatus Binatia bacterium]|nr:cyclic nucleotide-binding domain-containing protein [Candidatus Binatia bacterium]
MSHAQVISPGVPAASTGSADLRFATLAASDLFRNVPPDALASIRDALDEVALPAGGRLFAEGDPGDALYVVARGRLVAELRSVSGDLLGVGEFEPGQCVGELALLTGRPRSATVTAATDALLVRLPKDAFDRLVVEAPELARTLADSMAVRFHAQQVNRPLANLFGELAVDEVRELHRHLTWLRLAAGDVLFRAGDAGDAVYLILGGRLRAVDESSGTRRVVNEMFFGESVGEIALLTGATRSLTVEAARETYVARLAAEDFDALIERHPHVLKRLVRIVFERERRASSLAKAGTLSMCLLPAPDLAVPRFEEFVARFVRGVERAVGSTLHLSAARFDGAFGRAGASQTRPDHPLDVTIAGWLSEQEVRHRAVVYVADAVGSPWADRCLAHADRLLVVADAGGDPTPSALERQAVERCGATNCELVLLHPPDASRPQGTARWLEARGEQAHHHVRLGSDADAASAARRVTGRTIGLVLSGGAARGFAHIGVLRALGEAGWPIDAVCGTSMGAVVAGAYAVGYDYEGMVRIALSLAARRRLFDVTPPVVSFLASKKVSNVYREIYGDACIEDLWRPFFCVSTNLSRARLVQHERGPLWRAARASSSIAGLFAPVAWDGDLLVDGATMNNWPVDLMRRRCPAGTVIAVHVNPDVDRSAHYDYGAHLSGFHALGRHLAGLLFRRPRGDVPFIAGILTALSLVNDAMTTAEKRKLADLVIVPDVRAFNPLNFAVAQPLIDAGYTAAKTALAGASLPAAAAGA